MTGLHWLPLWGYVCVALEPLDFCLPKRVLPLFWAHVVRSDKRQYLIMRLFLLF